MTVIRNDFAVVSPKGAPVATFESATNAIRFCESRATTIPGLRVERVIVTEKRRPVWTPETEGASL